MTNEELKTQKWIICLHEGAHLLVGKYLSPQKASRAEAVYSTKYHCYAGLCSCPFPSEHLILECVFTAAGYEGARYASIRPTAPYTPPAEPEPTSQTEGQPEPPEAATVRTLLTCTGDREFLAQAVAQLYPEYREVRHWHRTHRRWRARARLILKENLPELLTIANELYEKSIYVYRPGAGASDAVGV